MQMDNFKEIIIYCGESDCKGEYCSNFYGGVLCSITFDTLYLSPVRNSTPNQIKYIRQREKVSQPVFAEYLNASASTIKKWESGEKHPTGPALKLLNIV